MRQFIHLRTHVPLACNHARFMYLNLSKNLDQTFVLLRLASQIRQLGRYTFFHSSSQKNIKLSMFQFKINHHILYTREKLVKAKTTDSDSCHVWIEVDRRASVCRMPACPLLLKPFYLLVERYNSSPVSLTNNHMLYGYLPENRSFHTFNLCLIVARFYIYTAAKESEPYSFLAF